MDEVIFDTGSGNKSRLISISKIAEKITDDQCTALMALHAYTRFETASAFKNNGKVKPIKLLQKERRFELTLI